MRCGGPLSHGRNCLSFVLGAGRTVRHVRPQMIKWVLSAPPRRVPVSLTTYWPANSRDERAAADAEKDVGDEREVAVPLLRGVIGADHYLRNRGFGPVIPRRRAC